MKLITTVPVLPVLLALSMGLGGCAYGRMEVDTGTAGARSVPGAGTTVTTSRIRASLDSTLGAAVIIGVMLSDGLHWFREDAPGRRRALSPAEAAQAGVELPRVVEQDCTQPVQIDAGNLRCR